MRPVNPRAVRRLALLPALLFGLSGCGLYDSWFGGREEPPLPGQRVAVLRADQSIRPDPMLSGASMALPPALVNVEWPQYGGTADHAMQHVALGDTLRRAWSVGVGDGSDRGRRLLAPPVVGGGRVYVLDARTQVTAVDAGTGARAWSIDLTPKDADGGFGGGLAYADGRLYVATGYGQVIAVDAATGGEIWRRSTRTPLRSPPTVAGGRVFAVTLDNRLEVTDVGSGAALWTHSGIAETTSLLGHASPAVAEGAVIVPYSSGEIFALRLETGRPIWSESLTAVRRSDIVSDLADIRGAPVVSAGMVYAVGHSGRSSAIDLRGGNRMWDRDIGGLQMPWVAGDTMFLVTTGNQVVAMQTLDGRVRWATSLPAYERPDRRENPILWAGPILAGNRLIVVSSQGQASFFSPFTGDKLADMDLGSAALVPPVVANQTLYVLTDDAVLSAYR